MIPPRWDGGPPRVIKEDFIKPGTGFGQHCHDIGEAEMLLFDLPWRFA
jgi:hypothetical protein